MTRGEYGWAPDSPKEIGGIIWRRNPMFDLDKHDVEVIHYCAMALAKLIVISFFLFPWPAIQLVRRKQTLGSSMLRRKLGRTGLEVTQLGYGSMGLRGPRTWGVRVIRNADAERFLNAVLDAGIHCIDTSLDYGISEERIGRYIIIRGSIAHGGPDAEIQRPALNDLWTRAKLDEVRPAGMSHATLILRYTLADPHLHTTSVGTCNVAHLADNVDAATKGPLPAELCRKIRSRIAACEGGGV